MELRDLFDYKNQLMKDICCSKEIVTLITDNKDSKVPNHTLPYTQVFPYEFVPETVDNGHTIVCFDVDIEYVENKTFYRPVLYIWIFTHKSKMRLDEGGIRTDEIASEMDKILNGSRYYGLGELDLKNVGRFSPILDYNGRVLTYSTREFNRGASKPALAKRKQYDRPQG